ncbi:hypothetical protein [Kutzneria buriramensis]|uniref:Uncharacterized protein n=1 Tax=Kutzneria buriramensis TaxID=1045776 RepID=A0A3E0HLF1_9PSEU|nr:hypothetical protein [Kutzneria buriramensis]REH47294.1 hypothetical protein BCF44_106459 [Kutzneria buriramensis]
MANKSTSLGVPAVLAVVATAYHVATLVADAESVLVNLRRFQADPRLPNLLRLLLAEGVFIEDFGLPD